MALSDSTAKVAYPPWFSCNRLFTLSNGIGSADFIVSTDSDEIVTFATVTITDNNNYKCRDRYILPGLSYFYEVKYEGGS